MIFTYISILLLLNVPNIEGSDSNTSIGTSNSTSNGTTVSINNETTSN